ncbi:hypothetical protein G6F68_020997 [Rhizopus microsporus]|nr:hypothetical protein G6F68_020997 [Rhizopus microsporus]
MKSGDPQRDVLPSALIDKPAPAFALPLVRGLPRRTPGADPLRREQARARDRLQLEGRSDRRAALAGTAGQSLHGGAQRC